jgi:hypothetical protein
MLRIPGLDKYDEAVKNLRETILFDGILTLYFKHENNFRGLKICRREFHHLGQMNYLIFFTVYLNIETFGTKAFLTLTFQNLFFYFCSNIFLSFFFC